MSKPAVWFPTIRCHSGTDTFTERLCAALNQSGIRAEITWLPHRAEYAPWTVPIPKPPAWANIAHINTWLHPRFVPWHLATVATMHHCVHDSALEPFKTSLQRLYHRFWIHRIESRILERADRVTAVSGYTAERTRAVFGRNAIQIIPNGVDTETFRPIDRAEPHNPFRLLYVGNWNKRKGVDLLGPILRTLGSDFELHYTTGRSGKNKDVSLPDNCHSLGRLNAEGLVQAYQHADALLFPSRLEGFGLAAAEAMACGVPVVAANSASLPEVISDGTTGLLCPTGDVATFASAARHLAGEKGLWQAMRKTARERAATLFDDTSQYKQFANLYNGLLAQGKLVS